MPGRQAVRALKIAALLLATVGLGLVWWAARGVPIPTVPIGEVGALMNLAYIRLEGQVSRALTYDPDSGYLGFWLADDTGEVHVNTYQEVTEALLAGGTIPAVGDTVSVAGTVRVREDLCSLTVDVADHLAVTRATAEPLPPGEITVLDEGRRVRVAGEVVAVATPYEGLTLIDVHGERGDITVAVDKTTEELSGELPEIAPGQAITVEGAVSLYKAEPQIVPAVAGDVETAEGPPATPAVSTVGSLSEISTADLGRRLRVAGHVVMLEGLSGGVKAILDDGSAQIVLLLWDDVHQALAAPRSLDVGAEVTATGKVQLYEEALEIIPDSAADVIVEVPAPPLPWVEVGALTAQDAGRVVRVRGVLGTPEGFSAGVKADIRDGTGAITVLFWSNVYDALVPEPQPDLQVEVAGVVDVYNGALELVPRSAYDWRVRVTED
jgi:DNA/RNA endonuclease YhcR with UshA esterase domain